MKQTIKVLENILDEIHQTGVSLDTPDENRAFESGMKYVQFIIERYLKIEKGASLKCRIGIVTAAIQTYLFKIVALVMKIMQKEQ